MCRVKNMFSQGLESTYNLQKDVDSATDDFEFSRVLMFVGSARSNSPKMPSIMNTMLHASWASGALAIQPWLNTSLNYEERLQSFISQLNLTQKLAMVQGDTVVRSR